MTSLDRREIEERMRPIMVKRWGVSRGMVREPYAYGDPVVQELSLLGIDLLDMAGLIMDLEDAFEITIPDEVWMNRFSTVKDVVDYTERHSKKENLTGRGRRASLAFSPVPASTFRSKTIVESKEEFSLIS